MIDEGCVVDREAYTALMSAYSRSGLFDKAFYILEKMKTISNCQPDVYTYSILIKSCLQVNDFGKVQSLLSDMEIQGIKPNTITYNTLLDAYGKAKEFIEMESLLVQMLRQRECQRRMDHELITESFRRQWTNRNDGEVLREVSESRHRTQHQDIHILLHAEIPLSWTLVTYNIVIDAFGRA
ncbi:UNVERIFIED_CONTAM: Pentatricopeptide repeat-containing protein, chloroplastic, partial [Sesamum angustifolium]